MQSVAARTTTRPVYANDVIIVGDSPQRRLFRDFVAVSPLLAAPLIAILQ